MAWNKESKAARRARVAKQLRDKYGKWIEMGGGVKWFKNGAWHNGTAAAFQGSNVVVKMKDGSEELVNHRQIEPIRAKGSIDATPAKPAGSVQARKSAPGAGNTVSIKDNDPGKRLTSNAADLEEGDEVHLVGKDSPKYSMSDKHAAGLEDTGFEVNTDDKGEPVRARVVDTSGDRVVVEDSAGKRHEIPKNDNVLMDDPEVDAALKNADSSQAEKNGDVAFDGLGLSDEEKANINAAESGADALQRLTDSEAGQYYPEARKIASDANKKFVSDYRKAIKDLTEKHATDSADAPKVEEKKSEGTPLAAIEKSAANLAEDIADIKSQKLTPESEDAALGEAVYDVKNDAGEEFLLTPKRGEEDDTHQVEVTDSAGNVVDTLPLEDQKPQDFAQAIKNSIESKSTPKDSAAPTEAPAAPKEDAPKAESATPTGPFADRIESVRDQLSAIAKDAFENNNTATENVDLGDGKIVEVTKGTDKGKVAGLTVKLRDKENAGNTSITTDQKGSQTSRDEKSFEDSVDRLKDVVAHLESRQAINGDDTPEAKKFAEEETKRRLEEGNKKIAEKKAVEAEAKKATEAPAAEADSRENLDKALKDAGFSDEEVKAIGDAAGSDESEADKQFFQSEVGRKNNVDASEQFKAARKALDDYMKANNETAKAAHDSSDQVRQDSADEKARADEHGSPEARADRAKETIDNGKARDEARAANNTDEKKLAELDRKITAGEKMLDDAKAKDNAPLVKRLEENINSLKKQRDALAPKQEDAAPAEEASTSNAPGTPFDAPEGGVQILSHNKNLNKQTADYLKAGDRFLSSAGSDGKPEAIEGGVLRATPDGESYQVVGVSRPSSAVTSITAQDSKGNLHQFDFGVGKRKRSIVLDTEKNRDLLGLTPKSSDSSEQNTPEVADTPESSAASLSQADVSSAMDQLESQVGKIKAKTIEGTIAKVAPVELPNGNVLTMGLDKGSIAYEVQDKDGNVLGHVSFMSGSQDKREQDILALAGQKGDESSNAPVDNAESKGTDPVGEEATPSEAAPKKEVTNDAIDGIMRGLDSSEGKLKVETKEQLVQQLKGGALTDGRHVQLVQDENGDLAWEAREKDGTPIGRVPYMDDKRFIDTEKRNAALRDLFNGSSNESTDAPATDAPAPEDANVPEADLEVPAEKDPEEQKLADDFIAETPQDSQDASQASTPEQIQSTVEEALSDVDDDLKDFGGEQTWEDMADRQWPIGDTGEYISIGARSNNDDRFLGHYDKDGNELNTFDMEGNSLDGPDNRSVDSGPDNGRGGDDSSGGGIPGGDGNGDSGAGTSDGENGSGDSVDPAEFDSRAQKLVSQVQRDIAIHGDDMQLDDEYSVEFTVNRSGNEVYRLHDSNDRTLISIARKNEDRLGEILRGYVNAQRELERAFATEAGSDGRKVTPTRQMQKLADVGTYFEDRRGTRFTKITPYSWGTSKAGDNSDSKIMSIIPGGDRAVVLGEVTLGHRVDHHRPMDEIQAMSDDELRQNIADFAERVHKIIEVDGKIGDKRGTSYAQSIKDNEDMQRFRYESHRLNEEAADYANTLWQRLRETGAHEDGTVNTGEFNSSPEIPYTTRDASVDHEQWTAVRNEYVGLDHRTLKNNFELRNAEKPSRGAVAWGNKMDKWARTGELADDFTMFRSILASPDAAAEFKAGNVVVDKGVMSLADNRDTAETYLEARIKRTAGKIPIMVEVEGRKGEKMTAADFGSDELVVPRGSKLFISSVEMDENDGILHVVARLNPSDAEIAEWTNKSTSGKSLAPEAAPAAPDATPETAPASTSTLKPLTKLSPNATNAETAAFAAEYWEERANLTPERDHKFQIVEKTTEDMELEQLDAEERGDFATANKLEAEIDALRSDLQDEVIANRAERIAAANGEAAKVSPKPKTPKGIPAKDPDNPVNGEDGFQQIDGSPLKGKPSGRFTQVDGFENGDRVFHGKHGAGTIIKRESNGQFARIMFDKDKDTGKVMGISLTKVTKGETAAPEAEAPKSPAKTISPRPTTVKAGSTAETGDWKNGERVTHGKHGAGTIKRLEGNGEYARVEFDGMPGTKGIKLTQLGRGDTPAPSKPETPTKVKTPKVPKAPLATAPEGSPGQMGGWSLEDKLTHRSKGSGTLKSFGKDGTFGMVEFDNEPGVQRGIRFSGLTKSDTTTPSSIADPPTAVNGPDGDPVNSGNTETRTDIPDGSTLKPVMGKNDAELYVGAVIVHPQLGRGRVVKIKHGDKASIQVVFDNDPDKKPKSLSGVRLKDVAIAPESQKDKTVI